MNVPTFLLSFPRARVRSSQRWLALGALTLLTALPVESAQRSPHTDWFSEAKYGVFMHFLPSREDGAHDVQAFDVAAVVKQLEEMGAGYFVLTLGQNSGYFNSPNAAYDRRVGSAPGNRCATRDLPAELYAALQPKGIRLMLYLPCQPPNQDPDAQAAFGLRRGPQDQPLDEAAATRWSEVIQEWADRYGEKVAGWWFDGGYQHIGFNDAIAARYAAAVKHGNPKAIVTFNPGVQIRRWTQAEDYTAGEINEPLAVLPQDRWVDGSQWHVLTYLGQTWGQRDTRFTEEQWVAWARQVTAKKGVLTLDMGPNYNSTEGPIGSFAAAQVQRVKALRSALRPAPRRLSRAESYFGLHFDFHAGADCKEVGKNTTPEMVERIIEAARPDYLQTDCKGHPGLSSYPTKVGHPAPGFVGDPLRVWREVTARRGVALYMHYSGVWDSEAIREHPEWGCVNADGKVNGNATSFWSPYADRLLIPQLRELSGDYGVDGVWVDGECWASVPDYSEAARQAFRAATGFATVPNHRKEPHWLEFLEFHRQAFRQYLRHYIAEVKRTHPGLQICSNWAFSDHMPEEVCAPVDWISGDFSPEDAVNSARLSGRYLAHQGKPWDLMAWSFTINGEKRNGSNRKSAVQLQREAAIVLAQGGGFQAYFTQARDGSVSMDYLPVIRDLAAFCRARQPYCQGGQPVPQIALLYSTTDHYRQINGLFHRDPSRLNGTLQALLESQQIVDVVSEHHLRGSLNKYPLIIVPECSYLAPAFRAQLVAYVKTGGRLLLIGPEAASLFAKELDVTLEPPQSEPRFLRSGSALIPTRDAVSPVKLGTHARGLGQLLPSQDTAAPAQPAASIRKLGRGEIAATYFSFSRGYLAQRAPAARSFLADLTRRLFPKPLAVVHGSADVELVVDQLGSQRAVHLINTSGPHADTKKPLLDRIEPLGPLVLELRTGTKPRQVTLQPERQPLRYSFRNGLARIEIPSVAIHGIVVVD